jgi:3-oxoacyl-[acyl-carrier-protein] synthase-3
MKRSIVHSVGSYVPEKAVYNEDLGQFPQSSLKRIEEKTGVRCRRVATEGQCTSDLALEAARACLSKVDFAPGKLDGIILSTSSPDRIQPATATRVQYALGAHAAFAFDINSVCSGSTFGICLADSLIKGARYENILFIAAEMYSRILNKQDFSTSPYFGDGAGAVLFKAEDSERGVLHSCLKTDGSRCDAICVPAGGTMLPFEKMTNPKQAYFRMRGKEDFGFAVEQGADIILQLVRETGISLGEVDHVITHQANINIVHEISSRIRVPFEKFVVNLDRYGNTASASVLIALDEAMSTGRIREGNLVVTVAFGGGLSWGANLIRM